MDSAVSFYYAYCYVYCIKILRNVAGKVCAYLEISKIEYLLYEEKC